MQVVSLVFEATLIQGFMYSFIDQPQLPSILPQI